MTDDVFNAAVVYEDADGATVFRASSLGYCIGALVRARLGVTGSAPPDTMQERFDEGHAWEQRVILAGLGVDWTQLDARALKQYGTVVEDIAGPQVETEIRWTAASGVKVIRCHPDAVVKHGSRTLDGADGNAERRVVEAKFFGSDLFYETVRGVAGAEKEFGAEMQARGLGYKYALQLSIEMLSTGLPALYVIGLKERDPSTGDLTLGEVWTMEVDTPPYSMAEVRARVYEVEGWVARGEMPPCVVPFDYPCAYWAEHEAKAPREEIKDNALQMLMVEWQMIVEAKDALEVDVASVKARVDARLGDMGIAGGPCGGWEIVTVTPEKGNVSWSRAYKALAKQTGERIDEDEYRGKVGDRYLRISKIAGEDEDG